MKKKKKWFLFNPKHKNLNISLTDKTDYYQKIIFKVLFIFFILNFISISTYFIIYNIFIIWLFAIPSIPLSLSLCSQIRKFGYSKYYNCKIKKSVVNFPTRDFNWLDKHISKNLEKVYKNHGSNIKQKYSAGKTYYMNLLKLKSISKYGTIVFKFNFWWNGSVISLLQLLINGLDVQLSFTNFKTKTNYSNFSLIFYIPRLIINFLISCFIIAFLFWVTFGNYSKSFLIIFDEPERYENPNNWQTINKCFENSIPFVIAHTNPLLHINKFVKKELDFPLYFNEIVDLRIFFKYKDKIQNSVSESMKSYSYFQHCPNFINFLENSLFVHEIKKEEKRDAISNIEIFLEKQGHRMSDSKFLVDSKDDNTSNGSKYFVHRNEKKNEPSLYLIEKYVLETENSKTMMNYFNIIKEFNTYNNRFDHPQFWLYSKVLLNKFFQDYIKQLNFKNYDLYFQVDLLYKEDPIEYLKQIPNLILEKISQNKISNFEEDLEMFVKFSFIIASMHKWDYRYSNIYMESDFDILVNKFQNWFIPKYNNLMFNDCFDGIIKFYDYEIGWGAKVPEWEKYKAKKQYLELTKIDDIKTFYDLSTLNNEGLNKLIHHYNNEKNINRIIFIYKLKKSPSSSLQKTDKNYIKFMKEIKITEPNSIIHKEYYNQIIKWKNELK